MTSLQDLKDEQISSSKSELVGKIRELEYKLKEKETQIKEIIKDVNDIEKDKKAFRELALYIKDCND